LHISNLFATHALAEGNGVVMITPRWIDRREKDPVPIVQRTGWAPGPFLTGAKNLTPPRFDPRTVQPVANRYVATLSQCA
jgi:hypothetical protein